mmetsp:Transcript_11199/g.23634  ORF Transcript_11199/g.23634 Transcript_11199/m.23634 type:complete len:107 (+) Transcript_11199:190-510(+)
MVVVIPNNDSDNNNHNNKTRGEEDDGCDCKLGTGNEHRVIISRHRTRRTNKNQAPLQIVDCEKGRQCVGGGSRSCRTHRQAGIDHGLPGTARVAGWSTARLRGQYC